MLVPLIWNEKIVNILLTIFSVLTIINLANIIFNYFKNMK